MPHLRAALLFAVGALTGASGWAFAPAAAEPTPPERTPVAGRAAPTERPASPPPPAPRSPLERAFSAAVEVRAGESYGAGVWLGDGRVLTAGHVLGGLAEARLRFEGEPWLDAVVVARDAGDDLAVLSVEGVDRPAPERRRASELGRGDALYSVGCPRELGFTVQRGVVSHLSRRFGESRVMQTDLPAEAGSSGGPVFDEQGRLVGVMSFVLRGSEGIAFVTPLEEAFDLLE